MQKIEKIFPQEILDQILSHLNVNQLFSCLLTNRYWCRLTIPFIWSSPFHNLNLTKNIENNNIKIGSLIKIYISCLQKNDKLLLEQFGLDLSNFSSPPLFNYVKFLKVLDYKLLEEYVVNVIRNTLNAEDQILINVVMTIMKSLCNMFMGGEQTLKNLILPFNGQILPEILLPNEYNSGLTNLQKIKFFVGSFNRSKLKNILEFLDAIPRIAPNITCLDIDVNFMDKIMADALVSLIERLNHLTNFKLREKSGGRQIIEKAINNLSSRALSLTLLELHNVHFHDLPLTGLAECKKLENLLIIQCCCLTYSNWQPLEDAKFPLKVLYLDSDFGSEVTISILKSTKNNQSIKQLHLSSATKNIIEILANLCPGLIHLDICVNNFSLPFIKNMIFELKELQYLTIMKFGIHNPRTLDLGNIHTSFLHYLEINFILTIEQLDALLSHCQAPLKTLILNQYLDKYQKADEYFLIILKFAKEKGTLKRLFMKELSNYVQILSYNEVRINIYELL
ncbi:876_t:CDS:2 [Diversispora eburnea]|uniref:876_t:CDS:1 n=1 Tax=Diversispora eburnea TaxID=1213867 RepID=A0A9N9AWL9_9GLOM|nr:876_t:CDS:2 [Diversispora eburnea]